MISIAQNRKLGRPMIYPEAHVMAERFEVTYPHALRIVQGKRKSAVLEAHLPAIREEVAKALEEGKTIEDILFGEIEKRKAGA